ncbi:uncharacterized protein G2W53_016461 [Senna tora]|uniref:Uncharacterized protein n=1 Tax=Senna tora TaxID=362788 RepID=A0A834TPZ5_9FABA|nr:uncharacterized protein G2W53_016461 [Senna tora]
MHQRQEKRLEKGILIEGVKTRAHGADRADPQNTISPWISSFQLTYAFPAPLSLQSWTRMQMLLLSFFGKMSGFGGSW